MVTSALTPASVTAVLLMLTTEAWKCLGWVGGGGGVHACVCWEE